ncbi:MAG TPA: type II toxin-antitoxin system RelE/ParE family toxin [bacterium]|nr:type II toxin-antitoxin system RelE/ParE family toxin [bacterium]
MRPRHKYEVKIMPHATRSLKKLNRDRELLERIDREIQSLVENPRPQGCKKLRSSKHDNLYRLRVGDWRILYAIEDDKLIVLILEVVRRDSAYIDI